MPKSEGLDPAEPEGEAHYRSGSGFGAVVWLVLAIPFLVSSLVIGSWIKILLVAVAIVLAILGLLNGVYFAAGKKRGGWSYGPKNKEG